MIRDAIKNYFILPKSKPHRFVILGIATSLIAGGMLWSQVLKQVLQPVSHQQTKQVVVPEIKTVTALGKLVAQATIKLLMR